MQETLKVTKDYLFASDFDQTLSFHDSGLVLSELVGVPARVFSHGLLIREWDKVRTDFVTLGPRRLLAEEAERLAAPSTPPPRRGHEVA